MTHTHTARSVTIALTFAAALITACAKVPPTPRVVDIKTADGVILKATLFPAAKPGPAVLLLHQCDEQRKVWDSLGVRLMNAGIGALSVDYRGYGESGGTPYAKLAPAELTRQMTETWPADIDSAFAFLARQSGVDTLRMGLGGGSCSVTKAVQLASRHGNIKALALLAGGVDHAGRLYIQSAGAPPVFTGAAQDDKYANFVELMSWTYSLSANPQSRAIQYADGGHAAVVFSKHPQFADSIAKWFAAVLQQKPELLPATNGRAMNAETITAIKELDQPGGAARVLLQLATARKQNPNAQLFPEYFVNQIGYEKLQGNDVTGAIEIFKLNVAAYPASPNAMDSLGDAYLSAGDTRNALLTAKQTLVLLKADTTDAPERIRSIREAAEQKIKQLESK